MNLIDPSLIKVGAVLKTKSGARVRILCTDRKDHTKLWPIVGLLDVGGMEFYCLWDVDGRGQDDEKRLVSIWTEPVEWDRSTTPPWLNWLAMEEDGRWYFYTHEPSFTGWEWVPAEEDSDFIKIPKNYSPKWTGDWKESLTKRP